MLVRPAIRLRRWLAASGLAILIISGVAVAVLRVRFEGPDLATTITDMMNRSMRGKIAVDSIKWPAAGLGAIVRGGWIPLEVNRVRIWDEEGQLVLDTPRLTAEIDIHALMYGRHDFVLRKIRVHGGWVHLREIAEPNPLHEYDRKVFSLLAAFYGVRKAGFYVGISATRRPVFDLRDFTIEDVDLEIWSGLKDGKYAFRALVHDVSASGFLYMDASDPLVPKFYFALAPAGGPGQIDILWERGNDGEWRGFYKFPIERLTVNTLKQIPTTWPASPVANTLTFDIEIDTVSRAKVTVKGAMIDYWDTPFGGAWQINVTVDNAGPMLKESILVDLGGDDVKVRAMVTGPIVFYPQIRIEITGLTYDLKDFVPANPVTGERPSVLLYLDRLNARYDLAVNTGDVEEFIARGVGGELKMSASFEGDGSDEAPFLVNALVDITEPLELTRWMPTCQSDVLGSKLAGRFRARRYKGDTKILAQLDQIDLRLGGVHAHGGTVYADQAFGTITVQDMNVQFRSTRARVGVTLDPRSTTMPPFEVLDASGRLGDLMALQRASTCANPKPAPGRRQRRLAGPPTRARRPAVVRPRSRAGMAAIPAPRAVRQAQRTPLDDVAFRGRAKADGPAIVATDVVFLDVPIFGTVTADSFRYLEERLTVANVRLPNLGGSIRADGVVRIGAAVALDRLRVVARNVDLGRLPLDKKRVTGGISADLTLRGPIDPTRMSAEGWACGNRVIVLGDAYADVGVWMGTAPTAIKACPRVSPPAGDPACIDVSKRGGRCVIARARREAGGELLARVSADKAQHLAGDVTITALPLAAVATLLGTTWPAGAIFDADRLQLGGTLAAPTVAGTLRVSRAWALGGFVGDGAIGFAPAGPGAVTIDGSFLDGRLTVRGRVTTTAPYRVDVTVELSRLALDGFVDLAALIGMPAARVAASGRIRLRTALADPRAPLDVTIDLSELTASVALPGFGDAPLPLDVRLGAPVSATFDGQDLRITSPATLETELGAIAIIGAVGATRLDLSAHGTLDVARALPLTGRLLDDARGTADLTVRVTGRPAAPRLNATLDVADVRIRPARQEAWLRIPAGRIEIDDATGAAAGPDRRALSFTGLSLEVDDGYSTEPASLAVSGGIVLQGASPADWGVIVTGSLGGEMLMLASVLAAPGAVTTASGAGDLNLRLFGKRARPRIDGTLTFDPTRPLTVFARGLARELALSEGSIAVTDDVDDPTRLVINVDDVGGTIDGEGRLRGIRGTVELVDFGIADGAADLTASLEAYPYRVPRKLDLIVNVDNLRLVLDQRQLEVAGKVELVSGRYLVDFNLGEVLRPAVASGPSAPPFWESSPMLANARLDLTVDARRFSVANNIASIDMEGGLTLTGTPRDPRFEGTILVQRGTFKIPGLRARFTRTSGAIQFESLLPLGQTPTLDITSEADYRDPTGTDHLIILRVEKTLAQPHFDLFTASGLNKAQTLTLIISGRTPDEFRRNLGQAAIGSDPTRINPSTDTSQGYTDELFRQAAGDLLTRAVADTLRDLSGLDVARIEFNLGSFGFHGEARVFENGRFVGDLERTSVGSTVNARLEYRLLTQTSAEASYLSKNYDDAGERDISDFEAKLVLRTTWRAPWR